MTDMISRQAAIDAICTEDCGMCAEVLEDLPAAQRWIPVSERLPEAGQRVLVTVRMIKADYVTVDTLRYCGGGSAGWQDRDECIVLAWCALPKPYQEENND